MKPTYKGSIESLKDYWDSRSRSFERDYGIRTEGVAKIANEVSALIEGKLVLDIGCGPGLLASFYPKTAEVIGLDFSTSMLRSARSRIPQLILGNCIDLSFRNEIFQIATCFFVASDYDAKEIIFSEAHRVLHDNGVFLFADYSPEDEHWKFRREIQSALGERCDIHIEDAESLSRKLKQTGFEIEKFKFIQFSAEFRKERYVKSDSEAQMLRKTCPALHKRLEECGQSGSINREFILLITRK
jgi:ubiquinone/menaquinone biosynthesis C-methylase UbiE